LTAKAFIAAHFEEPERTAYRNVRVAKYASPAEEARYGVAKLDLVINYVEAKLGAPAKGRVPIDFAKVKIPVQRAGEERRVGIEEATAKEIADKLSFGGVAPAALPELCQTLASLKLPVS
jgi:hypothetical protein